jgi:hypothetical protein
MGWFLELLVWRILGYGSIPARKIDPHASLDLRFDMVQSAGVKLLPGRQGSGFREDRGQESVPMAK